MPRQAKSSEPDVYTRLALLRADRGLSRQDLAAQIGVHYQTIGYLERGEYKPSLVIALQLARVFSLPVEEIFSLEPFPSLREQIAASRRGSTDETV